MAKKKSQQPEPPATMWLRFNQQPGQAAVPHTYGPYPSKKKAALRITFLPGVWVEVNGTWAEALQGSKLAAHFDYSSTKPE